MSEPGDIGTTWNSAMIPRPIGQVSVAGSSGCDSTYMIAMATETTCVIGKVHTCTARDLRYFWM